MSSQTSHTTRTTTSHGRLGLSQHYRKQTRQSNQPIHTLPSTNQSRKHPEKHPRNNRNQSHRPSQDDPINTTETTPASQTDQPAHIPAPIIPKTPQKTHSRNNQINHTAPHEATRPTLPETTTRHKSRTIIPTTRNHPTTRHLQQAPDSRTATNHQPDSSENITPHPPTTQHRAQNAPLEQSAGRFRRTVPGGVAGPSELTSGSVRPPSSCLGAAEPPHRAGSPEG